MCTCVCMYVFLKVAGCLFAGATSVSNLYCLVGKKSCSTLSLSASYYVKAHIQTDATSHNIVACCWGFSVSNAASVCRHGSKSLTGFKLYTTSANKCQHCCSSMQTDSSCWAKQCCVLLANNVASVCMGLKTYIV